MSRIVTRLLVSAVMFSAADEVLAGNGMNDIGFGPQSAGMAGADLAVSRDTAALNINPAGLTQLGNGAWDFYVEPYANITNRHTDQLGNDVKPHAPWGMPLGGGYARRLRDSGVVVGVGIFAQGGAGLAYKNVHTPVGTRDDLSSTFGTFKLAPGLAWRVTDQLSLGISSGLNYSMARQKVFPDTSYQDPNNPNASFYGFRTDGLAGWSVNGKVGFQYRPNSKWVLAGAYTSKTPIKLENGTLTVDYDAAGFGRVRYGEASQTGLAIPQEAGIGVSYQADEAWLIVAEVNWLDWSSAMKSTTLKAAQPDNTQLPQALQNLSFSSPLNWRDQYVIVLGTEHRCDEDTSLRFGLNYGRNPVPDATLSPTMAVIGETTVAAGFTRRLSAPWEISASAFYQIPFTARYTNPNSPLGPNASERWDGLVLNFMISRRW